MQSKVKLTRRQMKEDKFTTFMLTTKDQVSENWQFYVIGLVAIIVLVAAVVWYIDHQSAQASEATTKFSDAMLEYQAGNDQVAILGLSQVIDDYGSSAVAANATYLLANIYLSSRNYGEATRYFQQYLDKYKDNRLNRASCYAGIAAAYEGQGDYAQAASSYAQAYEEFPGGPLAADHAYGAMRSYIEADDLESADHWLTILKDKFAGSDSTRRAQRLYAEKTRS
jgi:TolA-binding protein